MDRCSSRARRLPTFLLIASLGTFAGPGRAEVLDPPAVETRVDEAAPGVPRVELVQKDEGLVELVAAALPAISEDGKRVAIAVIREDGARGDANLALEIRDVDSGGLLAQQPILEAGKGFVPGVGARIARANALLDKTTWARLSTATREERAGHDGDDDSVSSLRAGELTLTLRGSRFTVQNDAGRSLLTRNVPGWLAHSRPGPEGLRCDNPAHLAEARFDPGRRAVLVRVAYSGTDTCWEPDSRWQVLRLPAL